jgi:hypothetical protein
VLLAVPALTPLVHRLTQVAGAVLSWMRYGAGLERPARMRV